MLMRQWLKKDVGSLAANDSGLIDSIFGLQRPILTTNYDDILENFSHHSAVTWQSFADVQDVIAGKSLDIAHLHGHWKSPESIILGAKSYGQLLGDRPAQAIQRGLALTRSLIFIGCGDGLYDPNFDSLRSFLSDVMNGGTMEMFVLCKEDAEDSYKFSENENFRTIVYGEHYGDLEQYLRNLTPAGGVSLAEVAATRSSQQLAQEFIADSFQK